MIFPSEKNLQSFEQRPVILGSPPSPRIKAQTRDDLPEPFKPKMKFKPGVKRNLPSSCFLKKKK